METSSRILSGDGVVIEEADGRGGRFKIGRCRHFFEDVVRWKEKVTVGFYDGGYVG